MKFSIGLLLIFMCSFDCFSQGDYEKKQTSSKFFLSAGYGFGGSFWASSLPEWSPIPGNKVFAKKNFVGSAQELGFGYRLGKGWGIKAMLNYQHFQRHVNSVDTLNGVEVYFNHDIHHRNYLWCIATNKEIQSKKHLFDLGLGIYYIVTKDQRIEIYPRFVISNEIIWKGSYNGEGGIFCEFAYEYKFQPKINLGLRTQFYYTVSLGSAETITLFPYVKINF